MTRIYSNAVFILLIFIWLQINTLAKQTIDHQNDVDAMIANHTMTLLEMKRSISKTSGSSDNGFKLGSNTECNYYKPRQRTSAAVSETRTPWYPTEDDSQVVSMVWLAQFPNFYLFQFKKNTNCPLQLTLNDVKFWTQSSEHWIMRCRREIHLKWFSHGLSFESITNSNY